MELERIEVDTPPPSPVLFVDNSFDPDDIQEVISPRKRVKSSGNPRQPKRRKPDTARNPQQAPDHAFEHSYDPSELPDTDKPLEDGYARYVTAVKEGVAGFYALSVEIYVAQGWDNKLCCVKVSLAYDCKGVCTQKM